MARPPLSADYSDGVGGVWSQEGSAPRQTDVPSPPPGAGLKDRTGTSFPLLPAVLGAAQDKTELQLWGPCWTRCTCPQLCPPSGAFSHLGMDVVTQRPLQGPGGNCSRGQLTALSPDLPWSSKAQSKAQSGHSSAAHPRAALQTHPRPLGCCGGEQRQQEGTP